MIDSTHLAPPFIKKASHLVDFQKAVLFATMYFEVVSISRFTQVFWKNTNIL